MFLPLTTSLSPGLVSLNSTHLSLITLPAVLNHHGLFIHLTPATLPVGIVYVCVLSLCFLTLGTHALCAVFCVPVVYLFCFLPCWPFWFIIKKMFLHLDQVLPQCLPAPFHDSRSSSLCNVLFESQLFIKDYTKISDRS